MHIGIPRIAITLLALLSMLGPSNAQGVDYEQLSPVVELRGIWIDAGAIAILGTLMCISSSV